MPITVHNLNDPVDEAPEFWSRLAHMGANGTTKVSFGIYEEIKDGGTDLAGSSLVDWLFAPPRDGSRRLIRL